MNNNVLTHKSIDENISGNLVELGQGFSQVNLKTTEIMLAEKTGLIHGGFIFSAADYAAMLAVNHEGVVLGKAEITFIKPVILGDIVSFFGSLVRHISDIKKEVSVIGQVNNTIVFKGNFLCYIKNS